MEVILFLQIIGLSGIARGDGRGVGKKLVVQTVMREEGLCS